MDDAEELMTPDNLAQVEQGVYRSAFPLRRHFPFLVQGLRLRSILTLILEVRALRGVSVRLRV